MSPEELDRLFVTSMTNYENEKKKALDLAVSTTLEKAVESIRNNFNTSIKITVVVTGLINIWPRETAIELKKLGYNVEDNDSNGTYYLLFKKP